MHAPTRRTFLGAGLAGVAAVGLTGCATPYATSYLRLGPSIVTTPEQVDAAVDAIARLA